MISLLRLALALLVVWAAGAGPATELARRRAAGGWGVWAATSFVLGFGIVGLASVVAMLVGVRVGLFLPPVVAVLSLAWAVLRRPRGSSAPTEPAGALPRALVIAVAVAGAALAAAGDDPGWDVRAFWSLKARSIATHGTFRNPDFHEDVRLHSHPRYPLLAPSVHAWIHEVSGTWDGRPLRICMAAFFAASLGVVLQVLRRRVPERPAWLLTALFGATPAVLTAESGGALSGYVDYPLAIFLLVTVDRLAAWIEAPDPGAAAVAALGVACLSQMKDEGIAIAFLLVLLAPGVGLIHGGPRRAAGAAGLCVGGAALAAAWLLVRQSFLADDNHLGASPGLRIGWLPEVVRLLFSQMLRPKEWTLLWVAILAVLVLRPPSPRRPESLLPWTGIGLLLLYVLVWCAFPGESPKQVMRHGVNRLVLHVLPIFFVWTAGRVHEELQSRARRMPA